VLKKAVEGVDPARRGTYPNDGKFGGSHLGGSLTKEADVMLPSVDPLKHDEPCGPVGRQPAIFA
jgi:hypothetical protein